MELIREVSFMRNEKIFSELFFQESVALKSIRGVIRILYARHLDI